MLAWLLVPLAAGEPAPDADADGVPDAVDTCPHHPNADDQADPDGNGWGDTCAHPTATVDRTATLLARSYVGAGASVGAGAIVGREARIGAGARLDDGGILGAGARLADGAQVGARVAIGARAVVSGLVGDDVVVGVGTEIDGSVGAGAIVGAQSRVAAGAALAAGVRLTHRAHVGANASVGGGVHVGRDGRIGARSGLGDGVRLGPEVSVGEDSRIDDGSSLRRGASVGHRSRIGPGTRVQRRAAVHDDVDVGAAVRLGEACTIERFVDVPDLDVVARGEVRRFQGTYLVDAADGRRWSDGLVDRACEAYRHPTDPTRLYAGLTGSGAYRVDPDGGGPLPARTVWCEMELLGGGWTWLGQQAASATTFLGGAARGTPGVAPFSIDATGIPFREIAIVNLTHGHVHTRDYSVTSTWVGANTNQRHASMPQQFRQGQYGPSATMGCVDYSYGSDTLAYACDNDGGRGQKGHIAAYAGEFCSGGRLDNTWAWTDGSTCSYRGQAYTWGIAIR